MKSIRKAKPGDTVLGGRVTSHQSLTQDEVVEKTDGDWLPVRTSF